MKFVHIADMHFDVPFTSLHKKEFGIQRRLEQREILKKIIEYIKENQIDMLFICGDLYEHDYVKQSTIEYINSLFMQIPSTNIYIIPGNHDPIVKNSYYAQFNWSTNVEIFTEKLEVKHTEQVDIYGFGFNEFYMKSNQLSQLQIENPDKINILLTHGALDSGSEEEKQYNPLSKKELKQLGFDYIGLGHIHKPLYQEESERIIYPGSTIALGFDELGKHGMVVGEIKENKKIEIEFVPLDKKEFVERCVLVDDILDKEQLIQTIQTLSLQENNYYKIILTGKRNFEIPMQLIVPYVSKNVLKIKDETNLKIDLEELAKQHTLKGIFVKNMLQKIEQGEAREQIEKAIEIGLEAM